MASPSVSILFRHFPLHSVQICWHNNPLPMTIVVIYFWTPFFHWTTFQMPFSILFWSHADQMEFKSFALETIIDCECVGHIEIYNTIFVYSRIWLSDDYFKSKLKATWNNLTLRLIWIWSPAFITNKQI